MDPRMRDIVADATSSYTGNVSSTRATMPRFKSMGGGEATDILRALLLAERKALTQPKYTAKKQAGSSLGRSRTVSRGKYGTPMPGIGNGAPMRTPLWGSGAPKTLDYYSKMGLGAGRELDFWKMTPAEAAVISKSVPEGWRGQ